jgi:hypothetical protein
VNSILPGATFTEIERKTVTPEQKERIVALQCIPRPQVPEALVGALNVSAFMTGQSLTIEGTQSPVETLDGGWGSCRDRGALCRSGAQPRVRRAYRLWLSLQSRSAKRGIERCGTTHAWAEVLVPGAGWITFVPTNRSVGGLNLIPVAVVCDVRQAIPVSGSFVGMTDAFAGMSVEVLVTS